MALNSMRDIFNQIREQGCSFWEIVLAYDVDERMVSMRGTTTAR